MIKTVEYDYIIVGSGIAGLYSALLAREYGSVLLLTKGSIEDCNTQFAQGGIAAAIGPDDSAALHMEDTIEAGAGLCDHEAARILTHDGPQAITDLVRLGIAIDTANGAVALGREGAHRVPRVLHAGGDGTGAHIELTLANLARLSQIEVREFLAVTELLWDSRAHKVIGVRALNTHDRTQNLFHGNFVVLATGGAGQLFKYNTNPDVATGDGVALAYRAGAAVMDLEFYQFHPTALHLPAAPPFLISEAVRGEGGILRTSNGKSFMKRYHSFGDLAPRDVVSRAILTEMETSDTGHVLLDVTHIPPQTFATRFPTIYRTCLHYGIDIATSPIPVAPAAHYMMGGILTNTWGETTLPGLYACGEASCTGVHGANRLASNSLLETVVFGRRLIQRTTEHNWEGALPIDIVVKQSSGDRLSNLDDPPGISQLKELMWQNVGIYRDADSLHQAIQLLTEWEQRTREPVNLPSLELNNMILLGRLMAEAALLREESRGAHYRTDFPSPSNDWVKHITMGSPDDEYSKKDKIDA